MAKEKKQDCGWQFPKALEIVKCKEGNKEFMTSAIVTATKADKPFTVVRVYGRY